MVNRVITEHRAGSNKFDVLGGTSTSHEVLMKAGLVARNLTPLRRELRDGFIDADGYRVMPFTYAFVIGYNSRTVPNDQRPRSYEDLLQPKWKGEIALEAAAYEWLAALIDTMGRRQGAVVCAQIGGPKPESPTGQHLARPTDERGGVQSSDRRAALSDREF